MIKQRKNFIDRTGEEYSTNEGYSIKIIEYFDCENCTIQFTDGTLIKNTRYDHIKKGQIRNPFHKSVYGVGYTGIGRHSKWDGKKRMKKYEKWSGILERCYSEKCQIKFSSYVGALVCEEWKCFQNFGDWFECNFDSETMQGWALDKDILVKGNKIYSPETCCFVPQEINNLLTKASKMRGKCPIGVHILGTKFVAQISINKSMVHLGMFDTSEEAFQAYKTAKEAHIKELAYKWKPYITKPCYQALCNYRVEITD